MKEPVYTYALEFLNVAIVKDIAYKKVRDEIERRYWASPEAYPQDKYYHAAYKYYEQVKDCENYFERLLKYLDILEIKDYEINEKTFIEAGLLYEYQDGLHNETYETFYGNNKKAIKTFNELKKEFYKAYQLDKNGYVEYKNDDGSFRSSVRELYINGPYILKTVSYKGCVFQDVDYYYDKKKGGE